MERFSQRESVFLSRITPLKNPEVDFGDVFGGPPRRASMMVARSPWAGLSEKPVFGEESVNRRRYHSNDFFDDIFRGDESYSSSPSPRGIDRDPSCSTPGSTVLSPARPSPTRADPFGTSLPAQFSLPAELTKALDFPAFVSGNHSPHKYKDGTPNGISYPHPPNAAPPLFSSQAAKVHDELKNDVRTSHHRSRLFHEFPLRSEESSYMTKSNETDIGGDLKEDSKNADDPSDSSHFHFSIYKWAGRGIPLLLPLRGGNSSKSKKGQTKRCSSSNGRIEKDSKFSEVTKARVCDTNSLFLDYGILESSKSFKMEGEKEDKTSIHNSVETSQIVEKAVLKKPESKSLGNVQCTVENVLGGTILSNKRDETNKISTVTQEPEIRVSEETKKKNSTVTQEPHKPELKPMRSMLYDEVEEQGHEEITRKAEGKENMVKMTKVSHANVVDGKIENKPDGIRTSSKVNKASVQATPVNSGDNLRRSRVNGKVKEFIKIFDQEDSSKPKINIDTRNQNSRLKSTGINGADYEASARTSGINKTRPLPNLNKMPDASFLVDENVEQSKKQQSHIKTTFHKSSVNSSGQSDTSSFTESHPHDSKLGDIDDPFQEDFLIKELTHDQDELPQTGEDYVAIQVLDAKILQWSNGKKGNIRSLLSTLQYALWPGSGWKPVPLVDIIEGSAVKRAYQKALLCLHPDKLQQKGAASHQKHIAEKVFDILQEAWDHFNSLGTL